MPLLDANAFDSDHDLESVLALDIKKLCERFINDAMTIEPAPYLKVAAMLHREA